MQIEIRNTKRDRQVAQVDVRHAGAQQGDARQAQLAGVTEFQLGDGELLGIAFLGHESVAVAENQDVEIAGVDVLQATDVHALAVGHIAMHRKVAGGDQPAGDGLAFRLEVEKGGRQVDFGHARLSALAQDVCILQRGHWNIKAGSYLGEDDIVRFEDTYGR